MIIKKLYMIYDDPKHPNNLNTAHFNNWKACHMFLFEKDLFPEFEIYDDGKPVLHYTTIKGNTGYNYSLVFSKSVPGSVLFEIVNKHASAKL